MRKLIGRALVGMATAVMAATLLAPAASASPIGDAEAAMMAAWEKAGGDTSPLGPRKGDVYPAGDGFALDFDGGKMFYTTDTGAKFVYGPILDKYESLGGPAGSDLGFPTINEVPGLAGPDSRVATFSASDKPVIFWTSDRGAFVVRGALNAAWDKLGSSGGVLGAPVGDESYAGEVTSQKFSGGEISWNRKTKEFTTNPAALADQLKGLQVAIDPNAAINMAWRAAGGAGGPLGAKQGGSYPIGGDGVAQNFAGGKVFFNPATGANALETDILAKYESLGGPAGSDLGFPTANEADGGIGPSSRIATFAAADRPVIFWTADHGAFVVRGAMKAAWDKLRGPSGKLGAPVGDQAVDGDVVSQQFTGGKISWNRAKNSFSTDPSNLAPLLSGLQVSGQNQPSTAAMPSHAKKFTWQWWWLLAAIPVLVLILLAVLLAFAWRRRRRRRRAGDTATYEPERDPVAAGYEAPADPHWGHDDADLATDYVPFGELPEQQPPDDAGPAPRVSWTRGADAGAVEGDEDPDAVDTDSIPLVSGAALAEAGYDDVPEAEAGYPEVAGEEADYTGTEYLAGYADDEYGDAGYPDVAVPRTPPEAAYVGDIPVAGEPDADYAEVEPEDGAAAAEGLAAAAETRAGRHAATDEEEPAEAAPDAPVGAPVPTGRPMIHLPLDDPYQAPDGYPIKASARSGLYYTPGSALYHDTLAEIWLASEEVAQANGFVKAD
ncbi:LGFP repeat-containing protein [Mycobacterium sp. 1081908.1]|uniref:sunset domain-containing protein n=1 Tax=Mycobacterium sp. 1081908.1 TaxID=1834066 RepID=UPI0008011BD5|nr:LGFP repeat-containing protein [Mycobacterium sp. 1081908.1]OBK49533.1 hypothetical protein A5655_26715 [Mycobacterium sp. 1081908.1]